MRRANDISKDNIKLAIKHVCNFVKKANIVIMKSPYRPDFIPSYFVNSEVINLDRQF